MHLIHLPWLLVQRHLLRLSKLRLLILLCEIARSAAARAETVLATVALEMVFGAHVAARDHAEHEGDAETGEAGEGAAAHIAAGVALHVTVVLDTVLRAAVDDAWAAPGQETGREGGAARAAAVVPFLLHVGHCDGLCSLF